MQFKQNIPIPEEDDNTSKNFGPYEDEEFTLKEQEIEKDYTNLVSKSSDTESYIRDGLSGHTPQDGLFINESFSFLKEVRFSKQKFPASKLISNIKYYYSSF